MDLEFKGTYDKDIFYKAVVLTGLPSKANLFFRFLLICIVGIAVTVVLIQGADNWLRLIRLVIVIPLLIYFLLQPLIAGYFSAIRIWKDEDLRKPMSGIVNSLGITYISNTAQNEIRWEKFAKVSRTRNFTALLTADASISIFRQDFFANAGDWHRFNQMVDSKVVEPK